MYLSPLLINDVVDISPPSQLFISTMDSSHKIPNWYFMFSESVEGKPNLFMCKVHHQKRQCDQSSWSNLIRHLKSKNESNEVYEKWYEEKKKIDDFSVQSKLTKEAFIPKKDMEIDQWVENLIIDCGLHICLVRLQRFRKFMDRMVPGYKPLCVQTLRTHIINRKKEHEESAKKYILNARYITVTLDSGKNHRMESFMGVMGFDHDEEKWYLLKCTKVPFRHTAVNISKWFRDIILKQYKLYHMMVRLCTDG